MSKSKSEGVQLDMFPPFEIIKTGSGRVIVRTLEDGHGIKTRVNRLCEHFGGRYIHQEEGYVMTKAGVANMVAAYAAGAKAFFWLL
ncbi:hypothetical protein ACVWZ6_008117 [Bradyrhizobium sp. GM6.1]